MDIHLLSKEELVGEVQRLRQRLREWETAAETLKWVRVCSYCKQCWDEGKERWVQFESLFHARVGAEFTHGICTSCMALMKAGFKSGANGSGRPPAGGTAL